MGLSIGEKHVIVLSLQETNGRNDSRALQFARELDRLRAFRQASGELQLRAIFRVLNAGDEMECVMDFGEIYHFLFETYVGIGVLVGISLVLCVIIAAVLELRTRKTYVDRGPSDDDDEWALFDDDEDEKAE